MTELGVTLVAIGAWVLVAGTVGFVGSFLAQRIRGRQATKRVAEDRAGTTGVERPAVAEPRVAPASNPALVPVLASGRAFAERDRALATSTAA